LVDTILATIESLFKTGSPDAYAVGSTKPAKAAIPMKPVLGIETTKGLRLST